MNNFTYERTQGGLAVFVDDELKGWILRTLGGYAYQFIGKGADTPDYTTLEEAKEAFEVQYES